MSPIHVAIKKLLKNPSENWNKIIPYIKSKLEPSLRKSFEFFGIDKKSKPYPGHDELLATINFRNGFYVVCGGNDGYGFDPTYYLERFRNWKGVIIEPLPTAAKLCKNNRPNSQVFEYALVSNDYQESYIDLYDCNFMSVTQATQYDIEEWMRSGEEAQNITAKKLKVPAITLNKLIVDNSIETKIDLLVIDVEGSEEEVLRGFDLDKYKPEHILVEIHNDSLRTAIEDVLLDRYQFVEKLAHADFLYKHK